MQFHPMDPDELAFLESRSNLTQDSNGQTFYERTEEFDSAERVITLEKMLNLLAQSNEVIFAVRSNPVLRKKFVHATGAGKELLRYISNTLPQIEQHLTGHTFTPTVTAFIKHVNTLDLDVQWNALNSLSNLETDTAVDKLNYFLQALRSELQTDELRLEETKFKRNAKDNCNVLMKYFRDWFQYRAKVLVLRFDLGCGTSAHQVNNGGHGKPYAQMAEQMQAHRDLFFKHVRKHFKGEKVGYAWKLEYGLFKGFHCHVILLLNGDKHWSDVNLTKQLGEYWNTVITENHGLYFNCNAQKHVYKYPAVGLLYACDEGKWKGLECIARYLTKPDGYIKLELPGNSRVFSRGTSPKVPIVKLGRPRSKRAAHERLEVGSIRPRYPVYASQVNAPVA